ncbi:MAG: hypothetical protein QXF61_03025 [Nitrososphaeria archaeon]
MLEDICQFIEKIYELISAKGNLFSGPNSKLPINGIYFFFEKGQKIRIEDNEYDRVVRVGINEKPNNFVRRINDHYKGNIKASVFRENIGWALLERAGFKPKIVYKTKKNYKMQNSGGPLERTISEYFSENLTFKAFSIDYDKLKEYEKLLTGAFSIYYQYKIWKKELDIKNWLGSYSYSQGNKIKRAALWNSENVILVKTFEPLSFENDITKFSTVKFRTVLNDLLQGIV